MAITLSGTVAAADSNGTADIQVTQSVSNSTPSYNDTVNITTTVTNVGPGNASGVQVTNKLPTGLDWVSDDSNGTYNHTTGVWNIGDITLGTAKVLNIKTKVTATGTINDVAEKTAEVQNDPNLDNDSQLTVLNVSKTVDIRVADYPWATTVVNGIRVYQDSYAYSNTPVFTVDVRNIGGVNDNNYSDATGVVVQYVIGNGFEFIACDTRNVGTTTFANNILTWNIGTIPKGGMAFMTVVLKAIEGGNKTADLTTTAKLIAVDQKDINSANNQSSFSTTTPTSADIQVNQNVTGDLIYNNTVNIVITVTNNGPGSASGVNVTDLLPAGLTLNGMPVATQGTYNATTGVWTIGSLANNGTVTLTIPVKITATGTIKNTAQKSAQVENDWNYNNNAQQCTIEVSNAADIGVNQTVSNYTPNYKDNVTVTVNATNNGPDFARTVNITDLLPAGLQYISYSTNHGTYSNGVWTISNLLNGETATLTIMTQVVQACVINNTAIRTGGAQYDYNPANDEKTASLNVFEAADIQVNQTVSNQTPLFGDNVTITVNVKNNGPDNATGVKITDLIPAGLSLQSYSTNGKGTFTNGIWDIGNLNSNETATLTLIVKTLVTGNITNTATKTAETEYDYNTTNDYQSIQLNVSPGANHVTNFTTTGGVVNLDDGSTNTITSLPFNITLYGHSYSSFYISTNGLVSFGGKITDFRPSAPYDTAYVAPFWDDLDLQYGGSVYYTMTNDLIIITWDKVPSYRQGRNPTQFDTFQLRITRDGKFEFIYGDMEWKVGYSGYGGNSIAGFNRGSWWTYNNFWDASENLSILSNHSYWFDSNGNQIT